jgi:hypothetical protein
MAEAPDDTLTPTDPEELELGLQEGEVRLRVLDTARCDARGSGSRVRAGNRPARFQARMAEAEDAMGTKRGTKSVPPRLICKQKAPLSRAFPSSGGRI